MQLQLRDVIQKTTQFFRDKGFENPRLDTELLVARALNWDRLKLYLNFDYPMNDAELALARELVRRRATGEPVAYILGSRDFYNHSFFVNNAVLIPRPETESLVEAVISWTGSGAIQSDLIRIIDFGTGSGCVGLSLLAAIPNAQLVAIDISAQAIEVARKNAKQLEIADRVQFIENDVSTVTLGQIKQSFGEMDWQAHVIVGNPPYISESDPEIEKNVKAFEPAIALFSPDQGLAHLRAWAKMAATFANDGAMIMFEMGYTQGRAATQIFEDLGSFKQIEVGKDLSGRDRFIKAIKN
jgi:release factor glutamine methyltransferase